MVTGDWIAVFSLIANVVIGVAGVWAALHFHRKAKDYARELAERDRIDPVRKVLEFIRDSRDGDEYLVVLRSGRMLLILRVYEVCDFASRVDYQLRVAEADDPAIRRHDRPQFEAGSGAIRHDAIVLITAAQIGADKDGDNGYYRTNHLQHNGAYNGP